MTPRFTSSALLSAVVAKATSLISFAILLLGLSLAQAQEENGAVANTSQLNQAELEQILAPIALYPDTILSHILVAATYPLEVVQAERWSVKNSDLEGQAAVDAVREFDWDPSVQALVAFPQILKRMSQDLAWTQSLGEAFLANEAQVLASIQDLRELAAQAGSLDAMDKVTVSRDNTIIIIEPRRREVVYLPYYDTRRVFGAWRWPHYQPIFWDYPFGYTAYHDGYYAHNYHSAFFWGPSIYLSHGFYSSGFHWRNRHIVRISSRHYNPRRYYSHADIIQHRDAQRWEHDTRRGYTNRTQTARQAIAERDLRVAASNEGDLQRLQRSSVRPNSGPEQLQNRLANLRIRPTQNVTGGTVATPVPSTPSPNTPAPTYRRVDLFEGRSVTNGSSNGSVGNDANRNTATRLPDRVNRIQENRHIRNSQPAQQPTITQPRISQPPANRAIPAPAPQRSAPTPAPSYTPPATVSRPAATANARPSAPANTQRPTPSQRRVER